MKSSLGFLGPHGTYTEEAALEYAVGKGMLLKEYRTIDQVIQGVSEGQVDEGVVPMENSVEGSVNLTLDMLAHEVDLKIRGEIIRSISHSLLVPPGTEKGDIVKIYSHSQALSQCRRYLNRNFSRATVEVTGSTAQAAASVAHMGRGAAAIAPERNAAIYGLWVIDRGIQDHNCNVTRFVVLSREDHPYTGTDKTSIVLSIADRPGSLYNLLGIFASRKINLTRIESRPAKKNLGDYLFFIDFEGHRREEKVMETLQRIKEFSGFIKVFGSYPAASYLPAEGDSLPSE